MITCLVLTESSFQHVWHDDDPVNHRRRPQRLRGRHVVHQCVPHRRGLHGSTCWAPGHDLLPWPNDSGIVIILRRGGARLFAGDEFCRIYLGESTGWHRRSRCHDAVDDLGVAAYEQEEEGTVYRTRQCWIYDRAVDWCCGVWGASANFGLGEYPASVLFCVKSC